MAGDFDFEIENKSAIDDDIPKNGVNIALIC